MIIFRKKSGNERTKSVNKLAYEEKNDIFATLQKKREKHTIIPIQCFIEKKIIAYRAAAIAFFHVIFTTFSQQDGIYFIVHCHRLLHNLIMCPWPTAWNFAHFVTDRRIIKSSVLDEAMTFASKCGPNNAA